MEKWGYPGVDFHTGKRREFEWIPTVDKLRSGFPEGTKGEIQLWIPRVAPSSIPAIPPFPKGRLNPGFGVGYFHRNVCIQGIPGEFFQCVFLDENPLWFPHHQLKLFKPSPN